MATYRSIAASETDAQSPITQELMDAYRLNLIATAEGASGAPKIEAPALQQHSLVHADDTDDSSTELLTTTGNVLTTLVWSGVISQDTTGTTELGYQESTDGGSTYGGRNLLLTSTSGGGVVPGGGTITLSANVNAIRFYTNRPSGTVFGLFIRGDVYGEAGA